jgi:hypothetical protein
VSTATIDFDPSRYLTKVSGSDYLEVKWRLLWLRQTHPDASIETELVTHDGQAAIFKAKVSIPGGGSSTGWGSEQYGDFRDYIEKAETKALGRALAALGFGTQFCNDFAFGADQNRVVDAPVDLQRQLERRRSTSKQSPEVQEARPSDQPATARQHGFIDALVRELSISEDALKLEVESSFGAPVSGLSRRDASVLIERLQQRRAERPAAATA